MSVSEARELASGLRLSDPKPDRCASCFCGADADTRFVNFDSSIDRGAIVDEGTLAVLESIDELHLCESCVRSAAEVLGFRPELHRRQLSEIKKLDAVMDYWKERAFRAEQALEQERQLVQTRLGGAEPPASRRKRAA